MIVAVGSENPLKLHSVREVVKKIHRRAGFIPVKVSSGVSPNPLSNEETIAGARQRARRARALAGADWGIGLEGGMVRLAGRWFTCVWCVIWDGKRETLGGGVHFELPPSIVRGITRERKEMGTCMDELTGMNMTKRKMGAEGILTGGLVDRKTTFRNTVVYALAPRISEEYYRRGKRTEEGKKAEEVKKNEKEAF